MSSVTALYDARVAAGLLKDDAAQRDVLPELDRVAAALVQDDQPAPRAGWRGWFGGCRPSWA